jgi:hypothetical protein
MAEARCVHVGQIYSCTGPNGESVLLSCFGGNTGVQTCLDPSGQSLFIVSSRRASPPDPSSGSTSASYAQTAADDAAIEAQLSSAIPANEAPAVSTPSPSGTSRNARVPTTNRAD